MARLRLNTTINLKRAIIIYMPHKHYIWECPICHATFNSRRMFFEHKKTIHNSTLKHPAYPPGGPCKFCGRFLKYKTSLITHERHCPNNPNRVPGINYGKIHDDEYRKNCRNRALQGYKNGTWHGWMNCHASKKSYPEEFFIKVIDNEFNDKNYVYNYVFYQYRLDFAWCAKKLCIEIDGSQHERNIKQKESDIRKDALLRENGWKVLRIKWKDLFYKPKEDIQLAKDFIESDHTRQSS